MAAYAAVTSLMGTIHIITQSSLDLQEGNKEHLESLYQKAGSLLEFLDNSDNEDLQRNVKDLANEVEDEVESQVLLVMKKDEEHIPTEANERLLKILQQAIEDIDSVKEKLKQRNKNYNLLAGNHSLGGSSSPRSRVSTLENDMEGHNIEQELMLGQLTGRSSALDVISIVGMGGIGKSTFAKRMFSNPSVVSFFDVRGWITVSKDYSLRKMLLSLLQDAIGVDEELDEKRDEELADSLQKSLKRRRYLIVVDDIWSTEAWDEIRLCFPENNNRSRILLTTRDMKVAQYASYPKDPFPMRFLEPEESWNLFCQKAFGKKDCPAEFESAGKVVVENCKGLPLMISVVAGSLSSKRTLDEWNEVSQSVSSLVNLDDYQRCSGVLALSYNHLPSHLKACFLYFGVFKKASEISVEKLIRLWMAEGLFELRGFGELENVAANILHDLIDKSLIVVCKHSLDGKIKTCRIHDLLHDLCLRESESECLLYASNPSISGIHVPQDHRWVSVHRDPTHDCFSPFLTYSKTRSVHFLSGDLKYMNELGLGRFKLLRVLDLVGLKTHAFSDELSNLVSLRYLRGRFSGYLPIYKLQNLQTFSFYQGKFRTDGYHLPNGTWKMSQLRHLHSSSFYLCSPTKVSAIANDVKYRILKNLQSIHGLRPDCCTKEMFEGIKKVKKLGICGRTDDFWREPKCLDNLIYLPELEALKILLFDPTDSRLHQHPVPCVGSFPPNLKKLTLQGTHLLWSKLIIISKLPKLEVLQLKALQAFGDELGETVWEVSEMGFPKLKFLLLEKKGLKYWRATDDSFPCLERVIIKKCPSLQEIPQGFADSMTLQRIELWGCTPYLVTFAEGIQEEQESLGNSMFKVYAFDTITDTEYLLQLAIVQRDSDGEAAEGIVGKADEYSEEDTKCCGNLFSCWSCFS